MDLFICDLEKAFFNLSFKYYISIITCIRTNFYNLEEPVMIMRIYICYYYFELFCAFSLKDQRLKSGCASVFHQIVGLRVNMPDTFEQPQGLFGLLKL